MDKAEYLAHLALRAIPSVDWILKAAAFAPLIEEFGRERVKNALTRSHEEPAPKKELEMGAERSK